MDPDRVVLLGGGGFVGRTLLRVLEREEIPAVGLRSADLDLTAAEASERLVAILDAADALIMLAALTPDKGRGGPAFMENVRMAASVSAALQKVSVAHVVYFSSDAVYPLDSALITETSCAQPSDLYGAMHLAREMMLRASTTAPVAVLRPTTIYGADDPHNSYGPNRLRRSAHRDGRIRLFGLGEEMRDHVSVDDVAELALLVLRHRSEGTLNVATGRSTSFADLARKVAGLFARPIDIECTPRQQPVTHRHFDTANLRRVFPTFAFTPLDEGLARAHERMLGLK